MNFETYEVFMKKKIVNVLLCVLSIVLFCALLSFEEKEEVIEEYNGEYVVQDCTVNIHCDTLDVDDVINEAVTEKNDVCQEDMIDKTPDTSIEEPSIQPEEIENQLSHIEESVESETVENDFESIEPDISVEADCSGSESSGDHADSINGNFDNSDNNDRNDSLSDDWYENDILREISNRPGMVGRLFIQSVGINVAIFQTSICRNETQDIVDAKDSAAYMPDALEYFKQIIIGDHVYQGFDKIKNVCPGETIAYIDFGNHTQSYICTKKFIGRNTGSDLVDLSGASIAGQNDNGLCMYTCNYDGTITITYWSTV